MEKEWKTCNVFGSVITCDPGCNRYYSYPKSYKREELFKGMNLCEYNSNLPIVTVKKIMPEYIEIFSEGVAQKLTVGKRFDTPRRGLNYAYSEATISIE